MSSRKGGDDDGSIKISPAPVLLPLLKRWVVSATACSISETITYPLDVTKVRLHLQNELVRDKPSFGFLATFYRLITQDSIKSIYSGLSAAITRQAVSGGIGIGLYKPVRTLFYGNDKDFNTNTAPISARIAAGAFSGALGQAVASPIDLVKVRLQADRRNSLSSRKYLHMRDAFLKIAKTDGLWGFYRGIVPSVQRAAVINGSGIATYDTAKQYAMTLLHEDAGMAVHIVAALQSGLVSAIVANPIDVMKTRMMNASKEYAGTLDCLNKTIRNEGFFALYKGFGPSYARLAPWQLCFFVSYEFLHQHFLGESGI